MDDLVSLNARILSLVPGANENLRNVLDVLPVCVAKLKPGLVEFMTGLKSGTRLPYENCPDFSSINREYLNYARLVSRDIVHGNFDGLIVIHISMAQARVLARLTNKQIGDLSLYWRGLVFEVTMAATRALCPLHAGATSQYPVAVLAAAA
ncbi:MAG: hypothetical protein KF778_14265 [Rhodocyclaceae bacterium]|nr:hypothetical protein [Rhodocyclaceae bacterium]